MLATTFVHGQSSSDYWWLSDGRSIYWYVWGQEVAEWTPIYKSEGINGGWASIEKDSQDYQTAMDLLQANGGQPRPYSELIDYLKSQQQSNDDDYDDGLSQKSSITDLGGNDNNGKRQNSGTTNLNNNNQEEEDAIDRYYKKKEEEERKRQEEEIKRLKEEQKRQQEEIDRLKEQQQQQQQYDPNQQNKEDDKKEEQKQPIIIMPPPMGGGGGGQGGGGSGGGSGGGGQQGGSPGGMPGGMPQMPSTGRGSMSNVQKLNDLIQQANQRGIKVFPGPNGTAIVQLPTGEASKPIPISNLAKILEELLKMWSDTKVRQANMSKDESSQTEVL